MNQADSPEPTHVAYRLLREDVHLVSVVGRLDTPGTRAIEPGFAALTAYRGWRTILDLSAVPFLSSYGLRMLISNHKVLQTNGGEMHLVGASASVHEVLRLSGYEDLFPVHATVDAALDALKD